MFTTRRWIVLGLLACSLRAEGADKYTDENRPYEFGFNIEGEQHRHEKKDENGIIMGEYGFITADGVYHVTVYATDENGGFKILSMKNIRVKPYPTDAGRQGGGRALEVPRSPQPPQATQQQQPSRISSCSHCSIPTTPEPPPAPEDSQYERFPPYPEDYPNSGQNQYPSQPLPEFPNQYPDQNNPRQEYPEQNYVEPNYPQTPSAQRNPKYYNPSEIDNTEDFNIDPRFRQPDTNNQYEPVTKPMLISVDMRIVDSNTDVNKLNPGEREGLPTGLDKGDMMLLLYTFNYTVGFHGHHEEGYTNGAKKGYYYVTGRNGVRTRVDYTADDQGFHPKITQEVLDLLSDEVPKPETEKDEKYGLKGYEFKWIYYPVGSKR